MKPGREKMSSSSYFRLWMLAITILLYAAVAAGTYNGTCPSECRCSVTDQTDGPNVRVDCLVGGMTSIPISKLETTINQLVIAPPPKKPNFLTIGPVFTQPDPFANLTELTIVRSNVPTIGQHSFWGLVNLILLDLTDNNITQISIDNFRGLHNLKVLVLDYNAINNMPSETFRHMEQLRLLSLAHNNISKLNARSFRMLGLLETLDLSFNPLKELDPDIFKDIQQLKVFKCRRCLLSSINVQVYHIAPRIEELDLGHNLFKYLTIDTFSNLKRLRKLKFDGNQVAVVVFNAFKDNTQIWDLDLSHNRISILAPGAFDNLPYLSHLDISYNRLEKIHHQALEFIVKSIQSINISGNKLRVTEIESLLNFLPGILEVKMSNLSLEYIPPTFFKRNRELTSLDISWNKLNKFPLKFLTNTRYLNKFDISHNKITILEPEHLLRLEGIAKVNLSHNLWDCDECLMGSIFTYMNTSVLNESLRGLTCQTPARMQGITFAQLSTVPIESCFTYEEKVKIAVGFSIVILIMVAALMVLQFLTRTRSDNYVTNEDKRWQFDHNHPEEPLAGSNNDNVSTIRSPIHLAQNSS